MTRFIRRAFTVICAAVAGIVLMPGAYAAKSIKTGLPTVLLGQSARTGTAIDEINVRGVTTARELACGEKVTAMFGGLEMPLSRSGG
jgi:hypothetical protein